MTWKKRIIPMLLSAAVLSGCTPKQPNIVVFIADDISLGDLGCYGSPLVRTPNIDALAKDGMRFTNVFLTTASDSPGRVSIVTGRYPHNTGAAELHTPVGAEQVSFVRLLKEAGYYTAQAGAWGFGDSPDEPSGPFVQDFDRSGSHAGDGGGPSGAEQWIPCLQQRPRDKPFLMWFASHDAHRGWDDEIFLKRYKPEDVVLPPGFVDDEATREDFARYYNEVSRFDHFVGRAVMELKAQGLYKRTVIVVMADNGRPFPNAKTHLNPDGVQTPFIVHYPAGMKKGGHVCHALISSIDIAPTLCALAGVPASPTFQGRSFGALLKKPAETFRRYAFAERNWHDFEAYERMVCDGRYMLIENGRPELNAVGAVDAMGGGAGRSLLEGQANQTLNDLQNSIFRVPRPAVALYDYANDPALSEDLSASKPDVANELLSVLRRWQAETGDTLPEQITPDWYSRETLDTLPAAGVRGEMPGAAANASTVSEAGPF